MMKQSFVAFIDVLGFAEMVAADCANPRQEFANLRNLIEVMADLKSKIDQGSNIGYTQFSDSIVLHVPFQKEKFPQFISLCKMLQQSLFSKNILCRGGIAVGRHFSEQDFIFSEGLIEAYRIESKSARVPRIVVSRNLFLRPSMIQTD